MVPARPARRLCLQGSLGQTGPIVSTEKRIREHAYGGRRPTVASSREAAHSNHRPWEPPHRGPAATPLNGRGGCVAHSLKLARASRFAHSPLGLARRLLLCRGELCTRLHAGRRGTPAASTGSRVPAIMRTPFLPEKETMTDPVARIPQCLLRRIAALARDPAQVRHLDLGERRILVNAATILAATDPVAAEAALGALADESASSLSAELRRGLARLWAVLSTFDRIGFIARWATSPSRQRRALLGAVLANENLTPIVGLPTARACLAGEVASSASVPEERGDCETARMWHAGVVASS